MRYFISRRNSFKMFLRANDTIDERNNLFSSNKLMRQSSKITKIDFLFLWTKYNKIWKFSRKKRKNKEGKKRKQTSRRYFIFPLNSHDWYETILVSSRHSCWWKHSAQDKRDALFHCASWQTIIFLSTAFSAWKKRKEERKKEKGEKESRIVRGNTRNKARIAFRPFTMRGDDLAYILMSVRVIRETSIRAAYFCFPISLDKVE